MQLVYPPPNAVIYESSTFVMGSVRAGNHLMMNNQAVTLSGQGFFTFKIDLRDGKNTLVFQETTPVGKPVDKQSLTVTVPPPLPVLPSQPLAIYTDTLTVTQPVTLMPGDEWTVAVSASEGVDVFLSVPDLTEEAIPLLPKYPNDKHRGEMVDNRQRVFQQLHQTKTRIPKVGYYEGTLTIPDDANSLDAVPMALILKNTTDEKQFDLPSITIWQEPRPGVVTNNKAVVRPGPGHPERLTPQLKDTQLELTGLQEGWYRFNYPNGAGVGWIHKEDVSLDNSSQKGIAPVDIQTTPTSIQVNSKSAADQSQQFDSPLLGYDYENNNGELSLSCKTLSQKNLAKNELKGWMILIDPGHGGKEYGSTGPNGLREKDLNLTVSKQLAAALEKAGFTVRMTRGRDGELSLADRVQLAETQQADIVLSIHHNALPDGRDPAEHQGSCTFYYHDFARPLAEAIQKSLTQNAKLNDYGVFHESFVMTRIHQATAVLIELGFFTHPEEFERLIDPKFQQQAVQAITQSMVDYCTAP